VNNFDFLIFEFFFEFFLKMEHSSEIMGGHIFFIEVLFLRVEAKQSRFF